MKNNTHGHKNVSPQSSARSGSTETDPAGASATHQLVAGAMPLEQRTVTHHGWSQAGTQPWDPGGASARSFHRARAEASGSLRGAAAGQQLH